VLNERPPDLSLFLDTLRVRTLEAISAPYMIIGAFAAIVYGSTRTTYDIDIVVDLGEEHIQALIDAYPLPRYYADPQQMLDSMRMGIMFNIIDTSRGEKADLVPLTMDPRYSEAFQHRLRQMVELPDGQPFEIWCARPEDIIVGKLMAWAEGRSRKHETDIYEMMVFHYLDVDPEQSAAFDETYVDAQAETQGAEVAALGETIKDAARRAADRSDIQV
jgi:hypothetical protein